MSKEYYVKLDKEKKEFQVCKYVFNVFHPNGEEIIVTSRSYSSASPFSYREAKKYCLKMKKIFNSRRFKRERPVYV